MMAELLWPISFLIENLETLFNNINNSDIIASYCALMPFSKARTRAINRIGPHDKDVLSIIICGMLGDWWSHLIPGRFLNSVRFQIEQAVSNAAYIHHLNLLFYSLGYCPSFVPKLVKKSDKFKNIQTDNTADRFNYRLTLFTFTSFLWVHLGFYNSAGIKRVPLWIADFLTPIGLAHWIMQDGSRQIGQGVNLATNSFSYEDCVFLANILSSKFSFRTSVVKSGKPNQWKISIWKESMPVLAQLVKPYIIPEMRYKLQGYL